MCTNFLIRSRTLRHCPMQFAVISNTLLQKLPNESVFTRFVALKRLTRFCRSSCTARTFFRRGERTEHGRRTKGKRYRFACLWPLLVALLLLRWWRKRLHHRDAPKPRCACLCCACSPCFSQDKCEDVLVYKDTLGNLGVATASLQSLILYEGRQVDVA